MARSAERAQDVVNRDADSIPRFENTSDSIAGVARRHGIGETTIWREIRAGRLRAIKLGNRTLIRAADEAAWLANLQPLQTHAEIANREGRSKGRRGRAR